MTENHIPTEQELDTLLRQQPSFDLDTVKYHTFSLIESTPERSGRKRTPLRYLLIAAAVCVLSISALAAADYATDGQITKALGIRKAEAVTVAPPETVPEPEKTPAPEKAPDPERPAPSPAPEATPASDYLEFDKLDISLEDGDGYGWSSTILERDDRSITYLLSARLSGGEFLNDQTITVTAENYRHPHQYTEDEVVQLAGEAGKPYTSILYPDGTIDWKSRRRTLPPCPRRRHLSSPIHRALPSAAGRMAARWSPMAVSTATRQWRFIWFRTLTPWWRASGSSLGHCPIRTPPSTGRVRPSCSTPG